MIKEYAKGLIALLGAGATTVLALGDQFCGTAWPEIAGILTAILVVAVPNKRPE